MKNALLHSSLNISDSLAVKATASDGFSVLEALVAIAILSAAFLPLLWTQTQFVRAADSFERAERRLEARENALAYLKTQNFVRIETGTEQQGEVTVRWAARPLIASRMVKGPLGQEGRYRLTLYEVEVVLEIQERTFDTFIMQGLGWEPLYPIAFR